MYTIHVPTTDVHHIVQFALHYELVTLTIQPFVNFHVFQLKCFNYSI